MLAPRRRARLAIPFGLPALALAAAIGCGDTTPNGAATPGPGTSSSGSGSGSIPSPSPTGSTPSGPSDGGAPSPPSPPSATFRTIDTSQYLSIGARGALVASANAAGASETFTVIDANGGGLADGDAIALRDASGRYLSAANGGGGALSFGPTSAGDDESFVLVRVDAPGPIAAGDHVALRTKVTSNYVSAIDGGGGDVEANAPWDRAWETFVLGLPGAPSSDDSGSPTGPGADGGGSAAASAKAKVLAFLGGISGSSTAIGIENKTASTPHSDSDQMASMAGNGEYPSFWSADWGFGSGAVDHREDIVAEGKAQWAKGALVQYIYHACPPTMDEYCSWDDIKGSHLDDTQWADLTTPGGTLYKAWIARLDTLSPFFQELKDAGVAPLFRPHHEMNGSWAWWTGRPGASGSAKLFQITHDYLAVTKGFDNVIWVWNVQDYPTLASDVTAYHPGGAYFDVAALDVYNTGYTPGNYQAMVSASGGKPIGVAECQFLPTTATLASQPLWTYVAMWPDFYSDDTSLIPQLFGSSRVVTRSHMPGW